MKQWEYLSGRVYGEFEDTLLYPHPSSADSTITTRTTFNELGILGWELVGINGNIAYFKRELVVTGIYNTDISPALLALAERISEIA